VIQWCSLSDLIWGFCGVSPWGRFFFHVPYSAFTAAILTISISCFVAGFVHVGRLEKELMGMD